MILIGDNRDTLQTIPTGSVDCCVTSPPYWGQRDYGTSRWEGGDPNCDHRVRKDASARSSTLQGATDTVMHQQAGFPDQCRRCGARRIDSQIGLEKTPAEYLVELVAVFDQVQRVLADHGTCFVNIGDKVKDGQILGLPWRFAFAMVDAGWLLIAENIWHKPNAMPASYKNRCSIAHEQIFHFTKSREAYYDWFATSEPCSENTHSRGKGMTPKSGQNQPIVKNNDSFATATNEFVDRRNKRSVWSMMTGNCSEAHFATFPHELPETCILAGCPEKVCVECGKPWIRRVEKDRVATRPGNQTKVTGDSKVDGNRDPLRHVTKYVDMGFFAACECQAETRKGVVLDPFLGTGVSAQVAQDLFRDWVGCELNSDNVPLIRKRVQQLSLL